VRSFPIYVLLLCCSFPLSASESTGTKMTVRNSSDRYRNEVTIYWQSDRKRIEYRNTARYGLGPHIAVITRCDLGQIFELNLDSSQYESRPYPKDLTNELTQGSNQPRILLPEKPTIRIEIKTVDTGERKQLFGRTARHVITTTKRTPIEGSQFQPDETVREGWYVDLSQAISCEPWTGRGYAYAALVLSNPRGSKSEALPRPEFITIGKPETGFALQEVVTSDSTYKMADGTTKHTKYQFKTVVTELQEGLLGPALFEVPAGFKQVKQIDRTFPLASNPLEEVWDWAKYELTNLFTFD